MRTLIFLLFSVSIFAQEFNETIVVNDLQYSVVDRQFNHVFDMEDGEPVPFRIATVSSTAVEIDTYVPRHFETKFPRVVGMSPHEKPFLRYYVNGGMQLQHFAESTFDYVLDIPLEGVNHINLQWEWRGEIVQFDRDGNVSSTTLHPLPIGRRWHPIRN